MKTYSTIELPYYFTSLSNAVIRTKSSLTVVKFMQVLLVMRLYELKAVSLLLNSCKSSVYYFKSKEDTFTAERFPS